MRDTAGSEVSDATCMMESLADPPRFAVVFERHAREIHRFLARRVESSAVDDLLSETFVVAFRTRAGYDSTYPDSRPWLFGIAVNVIRHHRRSEGRRLVMMDRVAKDAVRQHEGGAAVVDVASDVVGADELGRLHRALSQLEEKYRDVLTLFTGPGLSYEEISRALQIPIGTVRSRMSRGRLQLRELLRASGQYPETGATEERHPIEEEYIP